MHGQAGELLYSFNASNLAITVGGGHLGGKTEVPGIDPVDFSADNGYLYARISDSQQRVALHLGLSYVKQDVDVSKFETTDPKVGLSLQPISGVTLRAAYFKTSQRPLIANATLEPTEFAGFNQLWNDPTGASATQWGLGLDLRMGSNTYLGGEVIDRSQDVPVLQTSLALSWRETFGRAYLYQAVPAGTFGQPLRGWSFALSGEYFLQDVQRQADFPVDGLVWLRTQLVPFTVTAYVNSSFALRMSATHVNRDGLLVGFSEFDPGAQFWTFGAAITYLLPRRHGTLSVGVSNALDRHYPIIDFDPAPLSVPPQQVVYSRLNVTF